MYSQLYFNFLLNFDENQIYKNIKYKDAIEITLINTFLKKNSRKQ